MTNRWDERYLRGEYGPKEAEPLLVRYASEIPPGRALDLACGLGRNAIWLASHGWQVTAVDYSAVALSDLKRRSGTLDIKTVLADIEAGKFHIASSAYDLIVDCCFLYRPLFTAMHDGLRPGGYLVSVFRMQPGRICTNPDYLIKAGELANYMKGWDVLHLTEGERAEVVARRPVLA